MSTITPAILTHSHWEFQELINKLAPTVTKFHIDVCDGAFTKKPSWPYIKLDDRFETMVTAGEGLPHWQEVDYDVHIMCEDPLKFTEQWMQVGAQRAFVHIEAFKDGADSDEAQAVFDLRNDFFDVGLAIKMDTDIAELAPFMEKFGPKAILCMSIVNIGAYGQPFDEGVLERLQTIRERYQETHLLVDGGVKEEHITPLVEIPTDEIIVGSAIVADPHPLGAFYNFKGLAETE